MRLKNLDGMGRAGGYHTMCAPGTRRIRITNNTRTPHIVILYVDWSVVHSVCTWIPTYMEHERERPNVI